MASNFAGVPLAFAAGAVLAFALGWGWPGIFNMAVVHLHRDSPGAATGVSQTGIYVGAGGGPAAFGALYSMSGYTVAWLVTATSDEAAAAVTAPTVTLGVTASRTSAGSSRRLTPALYWASGERNLVAIQRKM